MAQSQEGQRIRKRLTGHRPRRLRPAPARAGPLGVRFQLENTAHAIPSGAPIATAPSVTISDPKIMGNIPQVPAAKLSAGNQTLPVKKLKPASAKNGIPWLKTKTIIKKIAKIDEIAHNSKIHLMKRSPTALVLVLRSVRTSILDVIHRSFAKKRRGGDVCLTLSLSLSLLLSLLLPLLCMSAGRNLVRR